MRSIKGVFKISGDITLGRTVIVPVSHSGYSKNMEHVVHRVDHRAPNHVLMWVKNHLGRWRTIVACRRTKKAVLQKGCHGGGYRKFRRRKRPHRHRI